MVEHLVILKFKEDATQEQLDDFLEDVRELRTKIDGVVDLTAGPNFTDRSQGFTHGVCVRFADRSALERYLPHPAHVEVVEKRIKPIVDDLIVVDYEF